MMKFKSFFKTTIGMRPQSEGAADSEKKADVASGMKSAFGGGGSSPAPAPAPEAPSTPSASLGSTISSGLKSMIGQ
jgi:hypothetical protein